MTTKPFAEIIVDMTAKKLDRVFHYRIPPDMLGQLTEGMRVTVPFGSRIVEGYVVGFCQEAGVAGTKDIIGIVEEEPVLRPDLLALAGWMAERYMCSRVDALRAMIPGGARTQEHRYAIPAENPGISGEQINSVLNSREADIYNYILQKGKAPCREMGRLFGERLVSRALDKLVGHGLVEVVRETKLKARPRSVQAVELAIDGKKLDEELRRLMEKAPKQAAVLEAVRERPVAVTELCLRVGTGRGAVKELIRKGFLTEKQVIVRRDPFVAKEVADTGPLSLTGEQRAALREIILAVDRRTHETFLLHGVTGSGKTEVYLQAIAHCLAQGRQAIVLVPEISLTPQMVEHFKGRFGSLVAVLHSRLSTGERYDEWRLIKEGQVKVVVGARSAVFAPFQDPGLIIIDEEHETSYKQEDNPKYHARDVAVARARLCDSVVVLGSATPSLEAYTRAAAGRYRLLTLSGRVKGQPLPAVTVVDLREEMQAGHRSIFSRALIDRLGQALERKEQVILFLNRRGYSTFVVCRDCGLVMKCPKCSITLTYHAGDNTLRCHYCGFRRESPAACPACGSKNIRHFGTGTQKVEEEVARWFPGARTARMDMDTTSRKGSHEKILNRFRKGELDILVGTQMIAKGLDFPGVTLVGVITADTALNLPDFRSAERTFQLLTQVAGRAGRGDIPGEVIVQTYNPEHYSILFARAQDYHGFFREEMRNREALEYPPYCSLVRIVIYGTEENSVIRGSEILAGRLRAAMAEFRLGVGQPLLGPAPAPVSKLKNRYRWQVCVRGKPGQLLRRLVREAVSQTDNDRFFGGLGISIDVDPLGMA